VHWDYQCAQILRIATKNVGSKEVMAVLQVLPKEEPAMKTVPKRLQGVKPWKLRRVIGFGRDVAVRKHLRIPHRQKIAAMKRIRAKRQQERQQELAWSKSFVGSAAKKVFGVASNIKSGLKSMFGFGSDTKRSTAQLWRWDQTIEGPSIIEVVVIWYSIEAQRAATYENSKPAKSNVGPKHYLMRTLQWLLMFVMMLTLIRPAGGMEVGSDNAGSNFNSVPLFNGSPEDFGSWHTRFMAVAMIGGYAVACLRHGDGTFGEANCPADRCDCQCSLGYNFR
jgi:hypothetical protein